MEYISIKIKDLRLDKKMTQDEFAKACGMSKTTLVKYEKGQKATFSILEKIIKRFDLPTDYFVDKSSTVNVVELKKENALLKKSNERLQKMVDFLMAQLPEKFGNFLKGNIKIGLFPFDREIANITPVI